jgi:hypothetical protein
VTVVARKHMMWRANAGPTSCLAPQDHSGRELVANGSACTMADADSVLQKNVAMLPHHTWSVSIGQCPHFTHKQVWPGCLCGRRSP